MEAQDVEVIMPPFRKYHGSVQAIGARFRAVFQIRVAVRHFGTREEGEAWIVEKNAEEDNRGVKNIVYRQGDEYKCKLPNGKFFLFDAEALPLVHAHFWSLKGASYVRTVIIGDTGHQVEFTFHALLIGPAPAGMVIDHRNRDPLDNRRRNLRFLDARGNGINRTIDARNTSGVIGVSRDEKNGNYNWRAYWTDETGKKHIKRFSIHTYGEEGAKQQAVEWRKRIEAELPHYREALEL